MHAGQRIRAMGAPHWLLVFAVILGAWGLLYAMSLPADLRNAGAVYGRDFWLGLCSVTPDAAGLGRLALMWAAMSAAMMAPTFLPTLATYDDLTGTAAANRRGFFELLAGYMIVWLGFSGLVAGLQLWLFTLGWLTPLGQSTSSLFSAALLAVAGLYQFSSIKEACLSKCRQPITFFMQYWKPAPWNALGMGLRLGALCLGCCWALMVLAFVGGTMNLLWMGLATILMVLEKMPDIGRYITQPIGAALIAAAGWLTLTALIV